MRTDGTALFPRATIWVLTMERRRGLKERECLDLRHDVTCRARLCDVVVSLMKEQLLDGDGLRVGLQCCYSRTAVVLRLIVKKLLIRMLVDKC